MASESLVIDTSVAVLLLTGNQGLGNVVAGMDLNVSFATEIELFIFPGIAPADNIHVRRLLADCIIQGVNPGIKRSTIHLRRKYKFKLPDAIIAATALELGAPLVTADKKLYRAKEDLDIWMFQP
ncbi:MAG: type II toxin-antitoxin system VapC family toxin [Flavobacteriales bacterium]|nr:MAG: type II toxin-antitoxin system VapC family toxin [Flavobacteriales bacterium]